MCMSDFHLCVGALDLECGAATSLLSEKCFCLIWNNLIAFILCKILSYDNIIHRLKSLFAKSLLPAFYHQVFYCESYKPYRSWNSQGLEIANENLGGIISAKLLFYLENVT